VVAPCPSLLHNVNPAVRERREACVASSVRRWLKTEDVSDGRAGA
jgi:hypothetical protein